MCWGYMGGSALAVGGGGPLAAVVDYGRTESDGTGQTGVHLGAVTRRPLIVDRSSSGDRSTAQRLATARTPGRHGHGWPRLATGSSATAMATDRSGRMPDGVPACPTCQSVKFEKVLRFRQVDRLASPRGFGRTVFRIRSR